MFLAIKIFVLFVTSRIYNARIRVKGIGKIVWKPIIGIIVKFSTSKFTA